MKSCKNHALSLNVLRSNSFTITSLKGSSCVSFFTFCVGNRVQGSKKFIKRFILISFIQFSQRNKKEAVRHLLRLHRALSLEGILSFSLWVNREEGGAVSSTQEHGFLWYNNENNWLLLVLEWPSWHDHGKNLATKTNCPRFLSTTSSSTWPVPLSFQ